MAGKLRIQAQRMVTEEMQKLGWPEAELTSRRKGDPDKLKIALRLRQGTTTTLGWIVQRLQMGTKTHLSHLLYWNKRDHK